MKRLEIVGMDGVRLADCLVDITGDNFNLNFRLPMFLPVVSISITELPKEENDKITAQNRLARGIVI